MSNEEQRQWGAPQPNQQQPWEASPAAPQQWDAAPPHAYGQQPPAAPWAQPMGTPDQFYPQQPPGGHWLPGQPPPAPPGMAGVPGFPTMPGMPGMPGPGIPQIWEPGMLPMEMSYIENILRLNRGKRVTVYMTFEGNPQWGASTFSGLVQEAGRDHIIISDPETGQWYLLLMVFLNYVQFDEEITYDYPFSGVSPLAAYPPR